MFYGSVEKTTRFLRHSAH